MATTATIENPFARTHADVSAVPAVVRALRPMTGYEEEALEHLTGEPNVARVTNEILARCYVPPGHDWAAALTIVHEMTVLERDAAVVVLRILSAGEDVANEVACPRCAAQNVARFRLGDLPIARASRSPRVAVEVALPSGGSASLRLPSARDQEDLFDARLASAAARKSFLLARVLQRLRDESGPFTFDAVHALPSRDRDAMEKALDGALPELDLTMAAECVSCRERFEHPFEVSRFFFRS